MKVLISPYINKGFNIMLDYLLQLIPKAAPRQIYNWNRFVTILKLRTEILKSRFLIAPFIYTSGVNMLLKILHSVPINELKTLNNDYQRYTQLVYPMVEQHRMLFDQVYSGKLKTSYFTKNVETTELILNVSMDNPLSTLPMDQDWLQWKDLKPVRVLHYDSLELITTLQLFKLEFKKNPPTRCVYSIDISLLILKYWKYVQYQTDIGEAINPEEFLQQYIYTQWFEDLRNIWLFNLVSRMIFDEFDESLIFVDPLVQISNMIPGLKTDLYKIAELCNKKTLGIGDVVCSDWLDNITIFAWLTEINKATRVPELRQYQALDVVRGLPFANFIVKLTHKIGRPNIILMNRDLLYLIRRYRDMNIANILHDSKLRDVIKNELDDLYTRLIEYVPTPIHTQQSS